jgi:hypothetical protein
MAERLSSGDGGLDVLGEVPFPAGSAAVDIVQGVLLGEVPGGEHAAARNRNAR